MEKNCEVQLYVFLLSVNFISMQSITRLMKHLNGLLSSRRFLNVCYFRLLWIDGVEHGVITALRNQETVRAALFISSWSETDTIKQCGCVGA